MRNLLTVILALTAVVCQAQMVMLDKPMKAGKLTLFQEYNNPKSWYYVPDKVRLARSNGSPQFSFLKYVVNKPSSGSGGITQGEGGGILHCVVELGVSDAERSAAEAAVRAVDEDAKITGPIIFKSGTFGLITSFKKENGELATALVGTGKAPILEGQKAAVSILLTKTGAQLLWESFKTKTPDISFTFEMELEGLKGPYNAKLKADFDQVYLSHRFNTAATGKIGPVMVGADIALAFDELRKSGALVLESNLDDKAFDAMLSASYTKILELMFDKADPTTEKEKKPEPTTLESVSKFIKDLKNPPFMLTASYQMKSVRKSGRFEFDFKKSISSKLVMRFDENIGDLTSYMDNPQIFREVNLDDPLYKQREIAVILDGAAAADFKETVNFVTVTLRKAHQNGDVSLDSIRIDRESYNQKANFFRLMYGFKGDADRAAWLDYDYKVVWSFVGGKEVDLGWQKGSNDGITATAPFIRRTVSIDGDPDLLKEKGVRMAIIKVSFVGPDGQTYSAQTTVDAVKGPYSKSIQVVTPAGIIPMSYEVIWRKSDGTTQSGGVKKSGFEPIFYDSMSN